MNIQHIDRADFPPTIIGAHGEAWEIDLLTSRALCGETDETDTTVALWVVFAPWAHAYWSYYLIGAIHLRPMAKLKAPTIFLPGATHEIMIFALDPETVPDVVNSSKLRKLRPINFAGQWIVRERPNPVDLDRGAAAKVRVTVDEILAGVLSPDTDFRSEWVKRFSGSNVTR